MGVKKSTVCTRARFSESLYTPASSLVSKPTSTFGSVCRGRRRKTESSRLGLSFAAQPAALTMAVSLTAFAKALPSFTLSPPNADEQACEDSMIIACPQSHRRQRLLEWGGCCPARAEGCLRVAGPFSHWRCPREPTLRAR